MRKNLPGCILLFLSIGLFAAASAQDRFAYVITDMNQNSAGWSVLRKVDLASGVFGGVLLNGTASNASIFDASSQKQLATMSSPDGFNNSFAFNTGVAAIAFDRRNNRLYYTPMFIDQLRYIDLKTMKVYYVTDQPLAGQKNLRNEEGKIISRMVIAPDGYGYAVTNDGNQFMRFSTGRKLRIEQLGSLNDDASNKSFSIHERDVSWGGDMIADEDGMLYLISAHNNVFRIDTRTKTATWLTAIAGLPADFTTNGLAVTDDGRLLAGSQVYGKGWFTIDPQSWTASAFAAPNGTYLTSDLANSNLLTSRKSAVALLSPAQAAASVIQVYPNPLPAGDGQLRIRLLGLQPGDYKVELTDVTGKQVMSQKINFANQGQVQTIQLRKQTAQGVYMVKVTDVSRRSVFAQQLVKE
jgi:Secretion system C-terminal sorting domain